MPRRYKLAIVGSRDYPDLEQVRSYVRDLQPQWVRCVISGAARGVDRTAAEEARERGFTVHEFPAEWERFGRRAGHLRNRQLAEADLPF